MHTRYRPPTGNFVAYNRDVRCPLAEWRPSPHHDERPEGEVSLVLLHYTETATLVEAEKVLARRGLSAHFLMDLDGTVVQAVDTGRRAWHAGESSFQGRESVNAYSVGVEIVNRGPIGDGWDPYPAAQMDGLLGLLGWLGEAHPECRGVVAGHEDVAPGRKRDPGPAFPWRRLAVAGWPRAK